jgi:hypothetical protein
MKIEVTSDHIRHGVRHDPCKCPVALAATEAFRRQAYAQSTILHIPDMDDLYFVMGKRVSEFMLLYDLGWPVSPFSFEALTLPEGFVCR